MSQGYIVVLRCTNCQNKWDEVFRRGDVVTGQRATCPYCGFADEINRWSVFSRAHIVSEGKPAGRDEEGR